MRKSDYIVIQQPMISVLGLNGNALLVFAVIHGFTKDGEQHYRARVEDLMRWTGASERSVKGVLKTLLANGYIERSPVVFRGERTFEYWTNYDELLERVSAGEEVCLKKEKVQKLHPDKSAKIAPSEVQKLHEDGCKNCTSPIGTTSIPKVRDIYNYYFYLTARARERCPLQEEEKEEFYKIFFLKNAADPAAEMRSFLAYNDSNGWADTRGRKFDTPEKRRGLAQRWAIKSGTDRLSAGTGTDHEKEQQRKVNASFLKMLGELYMYAWEHPDEKVKPVRILDRRFRVRIQWQGPKSYVVGWLAGKPLLSWYGEHKSELEPIVRKYFPSMTELIFTEGA